MADKDVTRRAVERAARIAVNVQTKIRARIPYGPDKIQLTPAELRKAVANRPDKVAMLIQQLGMEQAMKLLLGDMNGSTEDSLTNTRL